MRFCYDKFKRCLWITCGLIILEMKAENEPAICLPVYFKSVKKNKTKQNKAKQTDQTKGKKSLLRRESNPGPSKCEANAYVNMHHDS